MTAQPPAVPEPDRPGTPSPPTPAKRERLNGWHITVSTAVGFVIVAVVLLISWLLARPNDHSSWADVIRSAVLAVGAIAAVPAGYVAYRKQQTTEKDYEREQAKLAFDQAKETSRQQELADANDRRIHEIGVANQRADTAAFSDRFTVVANQLGSDKAPVRLAGVYAMAQLADEWGCTDPAQRQTCIDVLCSYLPMPWPSGGDRAALTRRLAGHSTPAPTPGANRADHRVRAEESRVRETILRVIAAHVRKDRTQDHWRDDNFDLTGAELPGVKLDLCEFRGDFIADRANFNGEASFYDATFTNNASFDNATFTNNASFEFATFIKDAWFDGATFTKAAQFDGATFTKAARFDGATFAESAHFQIATFTEDTWFDGAVVVGAVVRPDSSISESTHGARPLGALLGFPDDPEPDDDDEPDPQTVS